MMQHRSIDTQRAPMRPPARAALPAPSEPASAKSVLVVEDESGLAEILALHLAAAGYTVWTARDGLEALYALERARPDVVVLDLNVPRISGFRLLQLLRRDAATATVPVLVLTALSFQEAREVARAGADDFCTKPCAPEAVVARVDHLAGRHAYHPPIAA
ncbi:MAG: response regulator [Chloroflexi bacterium]|nr:response regulator [Chloroflexota bacterium]